MITAIIVLLVLILLACMGWGEVLGELIVVIVVGAAGLAFLGAIAGGIIWAFIAYPGPALLAALGIGSAAAIGLAIHGTIWGCRWLIRNVGFTRSGLYHNIDFAYLGADCERVASDRWCGNDRVVDVYPLRRRRWWFRPK
jgi:hypothetical protein